MTGPKTPYPDSTLDEREAHDGSFAEPRRQSDEAATTKNQTDRPDGDDIRAEAARRGARAALSRWPLP